jgi:hypothetical protein
MSANSEITSAFVNPLNSADARIRWAWPDVSHSPATLIATNKSPISAPGHARRRGEEVVQASAGHLRRAIVARRAAYPLQAARR